MQVLGEGVVQTPYGARKIEDIEPGSRICDAFGGVQDVLAVRDWLDWEIWRVHFSDGTSILTSPEHLWLAWRSRTGRKSHGHARSDAFGRVHGPAAARIYETRGLLTEMEKGHRMRVPITEPAAGNFNRFKIDPYTLGVLLGDGSLVKSGVTITNHPDDIEIMGRVQQSQEMPLTLLQNKGKTAWNWRFPNATKTYGCLRQMGLLGKRAWEKSLPGGAIFAPAEWRWGLLQGLMDTDGWVEEGRGAYFTSTSPMLRDDVAALARSLGCFVTVTEKRPSYTHNGERHEGRPAWTLYIKSATPGKLFHLRRKREIAERLTPQSMAKQVVDIETDVGRMDGRCVQVDHPSGLYLADDYTVTHNSHALLMEPMRHVNVAGFSAVLFRRTTVDLRNQGGLWPESRGMYLPAGGRSRETPILEWRFPAGSTVQFAHLEHEKTAFSWQGAQVCMLGFDELTAFTAFQFWYLLSRNRSTCGVRPYVRATCNPEADSWVADLISWWIDQDTGYAIQERSGVLRWFIRLNDTLTWGDSPEDLAHHKDQRGEPIPPKSLTFIPATLEDNPKLMEVDPGYRANLMALTTVERERLLHGNWKIRPAAGLYFQRDWVDWIDARPAGTEWKWVRGWDLAATEWREGTDPDWTCGTLMGLNRQTGRLCIADHIYDRLSPHKVEQLLKETARQDNEKQATMVAIPQDPAQAGKHQVKSLSALLQGYDVRFRPASGDKITRFSPFSAQAEARNVDVVRGKWNERWFRELENFPPEEHGHDDDADSTSEAYAALIRRRGQRVAMTPPTVLIYD